MRITLFVALGVFLAGGATAGAQEPRFAGCYTLTMGTWTPPFSAGVRHHEVPARIRLDTVSRGAGWMLSPDIDYPNGHRFHGAPRWEVARDTLVLIWSNGFSPTVIRLAARGDTLVGQAIALSDLRYVPEPPPPSAPVSARRQQCES